MKKLLLTVVLAGCVSSAFAQGTINVYNRVANSVFSLIYGPDPANPALMLQGNTAAGFPVGTQVYGGAALQGSTYSAQLWAGADEASLAPVAAALTTFRTGTFAGAFVNLGEVAIPGFGIGSTPVLQVRAWDNTFGATWAEVIANPAGIFGWSAAFTAQPLGGGGVPPPNLVGLTSFNIAAVPEPSTFALLGLGALGMFLFRRK